MTKKPDINFILNNASKTLKTGNKKLAIQYLTECCNTQPGDSDIRREIGIFLQQNNMPIKAENFYRDSLCIDNNQSAIYFNLGVIYQSMNQTEQAIDAYQEAIRITENYARAYANLGFLFHETGQTEKSREACLKAIKLEPSNPQIKHMVAALGIEPPPETADQQYIKNLYKDYADHYDEHLSKTLKSNVPELIYQTTIKHLSKSSTASKLLDLGCGTGICGSLFTREATRIIGIDLSAEMIAEAKKKSHYSNLYVADISEFLHTNNEKFDIVISSDVLIYIGNLQSIFQGVYNAISNKGLFTFSIESAFNTKEDFILNATGRYKHNPEYIAKLAKLNNFKILTSNETPLREQNKQKVLGRIYALTKL